ncbi:MAG TPA: FHA domain-containing protein [Thermoanaerobaculia bacterium]
MAKIFFVGLDGTEKSYRLQTHRPFTVGRDPGNDIILRDPKVSRHHAEVVFERGFFVLHDLASANGTYVNGKRVRVAPLTHGAKVRMGNSYGRFSEELPTEEAESSSEPYEQIPSAQPIPTAPHQKAGALTLPHDKPEDDVKKKAK